MAFRVGQRVCCIATFTGGYGDEICPSIGQVVTIREFDLDRAGLADPVGLRFEEISNDPRLYNQGFIENSFPQSKFRPVVSTETGMAVLGQIRRDVTNKTALPIKEDEQV